MIDLIQALLSIKDEATMEAFLKDLMTPSELKAFSERIEIAKRLMNGESYRLIAEKTGASVTTVTRVARFLKDEPYQGYQTVLNRLNGKESE